MLHKWWRGNLQGVVIGSKQQSELLPVQCSLVRSLSSLSSCSSSSLLAFASPLHRADLSCTNMHSSIGKATSLIVKSGTGNKDDCSLPPEIKSRSRQRHHHANPSRFPVLSVNVPKMPADFGKYCFGTEQLKLAFGGKEETWQFYQSCIQRNRPLPIEMLEKIAAQLLKWATAHGATHYAHWFQPLHGGSAVKHETFLDRSSSSTVTTPILRFTAKQLMQSEADGSSFPNSGMRHTSTARGLVSWDPQSRPFLWFHDSHRCTLYLPSVFYSWETVPDRLSSLVVDKDEPNEFCSNSPLRLPSKKSLTKITTTRGKINEPRKVSARHSDVLRYLSLDHKIPLLRSTQVLQTQILRLMNLIDQAFHGSTDPSTIPPQHTAAHVESGLEQEFFLIDKKLFDERADLQATGRTLFDGLPPKHQQFEDQYFGHPQNRTLNFIQHVEEQMWLLGVLMQTRHKEVAPGQYELAPRFENVNVAIDQNHLLMMMLRELAPKHGFQVLFHEKPFQGVNGSGKHNNWSFGTNQIPSVFKDTLWDLCPSSTRALTTAEHSSIPLPSPIQRKEHLRYLLCMGIMLRALHLHAPLMRLAIAGTGNDERLGGCEAPPAIISVYLGEDTWNKLKLFVDTMSMRQSINRDIENWRTKMQKNQEKHNCGANHLYGSRQFGKSYNVGIYYELLLKSKTTSSFKQACSGVSTGIPGLPTLPHPLCDRNRTSPIAMNGNKFEIRAVGASHSASVSTQFLNTIVADSIQHVIAEIESKWNQQTANKNGSQATFNGEVMMMDVASRLLKRHQNIVFNGNGYSKEWTIEAVDRRHLPHYPTTADILCAYTESPPLSLANDEQTGKTKQTSSFSVLHRQMSHLFAKHDILVPKEVTSLLETMKHKHLQTVGLEAKVACEMVIGRVIPAIRSECIKIQKLMINTNLSHLAEEREYLETLHEGLIAVTYEINTYLRCDLDLSLVQDLTKLLAHQRKLVDSFTSRFYAGKQKQKSLWPMYHSLLKPL